MSYFPELDAMPLKTLISRFLSDDLAEHQLAERGLWFQEVAVSIAKYGTDGLSFLIRTIPDADGERLRAVLLSFSFLPKRTKKKRLEEVSGLLRLFLRHEDPLIVAEAIDSLSALGITDAFPDVYTLKSHDSGFVVGAALRYLSKWYPERAKPILLEALKSRDPLVRQNAVDEVDSLDFRQALPLLRTLLVDSDKNVRQAAETAIANLEMPGKDVPLKESGSGDSSHNTMA